MQDLMLFEIKKEGEPLSFSSLSQGRRYLGAHRPPGTNISFVKRRVACHGQIEISISRLAAWQKVVANDTGMITCIDKSATLQPVVRFSNFCRRLLRFLRRCPSHTIKDRSRGP
ncbi:hypothetical protein KM043_011878 [Ampulex compressa]|nr:hypothetical protein KM043_011878 [Ampulex compressa]